MHVNTSSSSNFNQYAPLIDVAGTLCYVAGVVSFVALGVILGTVLVPLAVGGAFVVTGFLLSRWADFVRVKSEPSTNPASSSPAFQEHIRPTHTAQHIVQSPVSAPSLLSQSQAVKRVDETPDINEESKALIKEYLTQETYASVTIERYIGFARQHKANPESNNPVSNLIAFRAAKKQFEDYVAGIGPRLKEQGLKDEVIQNLLSEKGTIGLAIKVVKTGLSFQNDLSTDGSIAQSDFSRFESGKSTIEKLVTWAIENKQSD